MPDEPRPLSWTEQGQAAGFDDAWHEDWWRRMEESGGNVIAAYHMRMVEVSDERVVMRVPDQPMPRPKQPSSQACRRSKTVDSALDCATLRNQR